MAQFWMEKRVIETNPTGHYVQARVAIDPHDKMALMIVTAHATSVYDRGGGVDSGIVLTIMGRTGGVSTLVKSDSFEARSSTVTYNASAPFTLVVQPNAVAQIFATVEAIGTAGIYNHSTRVELHVVALDI